MSISENKLLIRRFVDDFMNAGDGAVADTLIAAEFVEHEPTPVPVHGPPGLKEFFGILRTAFPDLHFAIEDIIADSDRVVCRMRFRATQHGPFAGHPPTGRTAEVDVIDIFRIANGRIVEHWGVLDQLGLLEQLGLLNRGRSGA